MLQGLSATCSNAAAFSHPTTILSIAASIAGNNLAIALGDRTQSKAVVKAAWRLDGRIRDVSALGPDRNIPNVQNSNEP